MYVNHVNIDRCYITVNRYINTILIIIDPIMQNFLCSYEIFFNI